MTSKNHSSGSAASLGAFDGRIARWFRERYGPPSDIQTAAWPAIAAGGHVLMTAPTGSGKTLAAFLWALNQLLCGKWADGCPRVLYVSPLKALNTDIQRNLLGPLAELTPMFTDGEGRRPAIRVLTRSGDTPQSERRRMLRQPPEILITTPESLNLLLNSRGGQSLLGGLQTVILDEIHAVAGSKRGTHLITAVERLVPLSGEFQRVALSATVRPLAPMADFVGGYALGGAIDNPDYTKRRVAIIPAAGRKTYRVTVHYPDAGGGPPKTDSVWEPLAEVFLAKARRNRSTLIFTNSRKLSEKMAYLVNAAAGELLAYAHHGSLARELRQQVEGRLKSGELKAVFATSSLELGIDIGQLDEVVLLQTPPTISGAVQRAGRAGHQVGAPSRTAIYCTHPGDLVSAAVLGRAIEDQDIETLAPVQAPLDVLAQVLVGMVALAEMDRRELFQRIRCAAPYHDLSQRRFDLVLEMLSGRYAHTRVRELQARLSVDLATGMVRARKGALQALYMSGGTIPDRGYFTLRHHKGGTRIGELDEEFVWEARTGQVFTLGTQNWQVRKITASDVFVRPAPGNRVAPPFWKADSGGRDGHFARRVAEFLEWIDPRLRDPDRSAELPAELQRSHHLDPPAAQALLSWLAKQRRHTGCPLPHRHHVVVERICSGPGGAPGSQLAFHLPWGGRLTRPLAMALEAALETHSGQAPEVFAADDLILIVNPPEIDTQRLLEMVASDTLLPLLRRRLERSGYFGAQFRTGAGRALLITRGGLRRRMPLWMTRLKAQKLMAAVMGLADFPLLLEAWRSCLQDGFDLGTLQKRLQELDRGEIRLSETVTQTPSPMAQAAAWGQINDYMYRDDGLKDAARSKLQDDLLKEVVFSAALRPQVSAELVTAFEAKRQRLAPGYAPADAVELTEWVRDRLLMPGDEWRKLLRAVERDHGIDRDGLLAEAGGRLVQVRPGAGNSAFEPLISTIDLAPMLMAAFWADLSGAIEIEALPGATPLDLPGAEEVPAVAPETLIGQWLSYYGPADPVWVQATLAIDHRRLLGWLDALVGDERLIRGALAAPGEVELICDAENFDILLRLARAARRERVPALPLEDLPLLLAQFQGVTSAATDKQRRAAREANATGPEGVLDHLARLSGWPASAAQWEAEILPVRMPGYQPAWLDAALQTGDLVWQGCGRERLTFCYHDELDLLMEPAPAEAAAAAHPADPASAAEPRGGGEGGAGIGLPMTGAPNGARYPFDSLRGDQPADEVYRRLWRWVWEGRVVNDGYQAVRQAIANRFKWPQGVPAAMRRGRRRSVPRRPPQRVPGNWYRPALPPAPEDELAALELDKARVRLALGRYGILLRPLMERELGPFAWGRLFRALRLMELAGEVVGGHFVEGAPGPQFISREMEALLFGGLDHERIFLLNATDPASCCGLGLDWDRVESTASRAELPASQAELPARRAELPARRATTHLLYHGNRLVLVSRRNGRRLRFHVAVDDPYISQYLYLIEHMLNHRANGARGVVIDTINAAAASLSPYLAPLKARFEVAMAPNNVTVYRRWISSA
jgi:ATP-dependent Lhr-like helicase